MKEFLRRVTIVFNRTFRRHDFPMRMDDRITRFAVEGKSSFPAWVKQGNGIQCIGKFSIATALGLDGRQWQSEAKDYGQARAELQRGMAKLGVW